MSVRSMRPGDEPAVRALQSLLSVSDSDLVAPACDGPLVGVLAIDEAPVGYAIAAPGPVATLLEIAVVSQTRLRGHGRRLVEAIESRVNSAKVLATTPADDEEAIAFYRSVGFELDRRLPDFYDGRDGLRFRRSA